MFLDIHTNLHPSFGPNTMPSLPTNIQPRTLSAILPSPSELSKKTKKASPPWRHQTFRSPPSSIHFHKSISTRHPHFTSSERPVCTQPTMINNDTTTRQKSTPGDSAHRAPTRGFYPNFKKNNTNYKTSMAPISSKIIELIGSEGYIYIYIYISEWYSHREATGSQTWRSYYNNTSHHAVARYYRKLPNDYCFGDRISHTNMAEY